MLDDSVLYTCRRLEGAEELSYQFGSVPPFQELSILALWQQAGAHRQNTADTGTDRIPESTLKCCRHSTNPCTPLWHRAQGIGDLVIPLPGLRVASQQGAP